MPNVYYSTRRRRSLPSVLSKHSAKPPRHRSKTPPKLLSHWLSPPQPDKTLLSLSLTPSRTAQPEHLHFFSLPPPRPAASPPPVPSPSPQASPRRPSSGAYPCPPLLLLEPRPPVPGSPPAAVARAEAPALPWRRSPPVAGARTPPPTSSASRPRDGVSMV